MQLTSKVVVITGASSGIGRELAFQFAAKGSTVVLAARNASAIREAASRIQESGGSALDIPTDVSRRSDVETLMKTTFERFGRIDIVVNNAGISPAKGIILENSESDVRATLETNFMGSLYGVWASVPYMEKNGGGQLLFVSSIIGKRGIPRNAAYCASKFAIQGLTESIRPELARRNIRVITICPAGVATPFYANNGKPEKRRYRLHRVDKIAAMIVKASEKEKREVLLTLDAKLLHYLNVFFPTLMDKAIAKAKGV